MVSLRVRFNALPVDFFGIGFYDLGLYLYFFLRFFANLFNCYKCVGFWFLFTIANSQAVFLRAFRDFRMSVFIIWRIFSEWDKRLRHAADIGHLPSLNPKRFRPVVKCPSMCLQSPSITSIDYKRLIVIKIRVLLFPLNYARTTDSPPTTKLFISEILKIKKKSLKNIVVYLF